MGLIALNGVAGFSSTQHGAPGAGFSTAQQAGFASGAGQQGGLAGSVA